MRSEHAELIKYERHARQNQKSEKQKTQLGCSVQGQGQYCIKWLGMAKLAPTGKQWLATPGPTGKLSRSLALLIKQVLQA